MSDETERLIARAEAWTSPGSAGYDDVRALAAHARILAAKAPEPTMDEELARLIEDARTMWRRFKAVDPEASVERGARYKAFEFAAEMAADHARALCREPSAAASTAAPEGALPVLRTCVTCGKPTEYGCSDCAIDGYKVAVCKATACLDAHEAAAQCRPPMPVVLPLLPATCGECRHCGGQWREVPGLAGSCHHPAIVRIGSMALIPEAPPPRACPLRGGR